MIKNNIFFKTLIKIFLYLIKNFLKKIDSLLSSELSVFFQNFFCLIIFSNVRFKYLKEKKIYLAYEKNYTHYFSNRKRGYDLYRSGVLNRGKFLYKSYLLNLIKFSKNDVIVDCGSNYGDLYIYLSKYIKAENFIAFEPGNEEFRSLKYNIKKGRIFNFALSNKNHISNFYLNSENADSSLIKPENFTKIEKIQNITLDKFFKQSKINKVKLLKVEAEGAEPEVLLGGKNSLKFIEFISVDGSNERGVKKEETFSKLSNYLISKKFRLVKLNGEAYRGLFKNIRYKN